MRKLNGRCLTISKLQGNKGFTLVEVITSFAVLAIVSVALLQMFVVSTRTNRSAYDMDKANVLCVKLGEEYKADPDITVTFTSTSAGIGAETVYKNYYNRNWNNTTDLTEAEFMLEIVEEPVTSSAISVSYHPDFAWEGSIDPVDDAGNINNYTLNIDSTSPTECSSKLTGGIASPVDMSKVPIHSGVAKIPIKLICSDSEKTLTTSSIVTVNNNVTALSGAGIVIADIYICDSPAGAGVNITPGNGSSSESKISSGTDISENHFAKVRVSRIADGLLMAENSIKTHLVR